MSTPTQLDAAVPIVDKGGNATRSWQIWLQRVLDLIDKLPDRSDVNAVTPLGVVWVYYGPSPPGAAWLFMQGQVVARSAYPAFVAWWQKQFGGAGDNVTLPTVAAPFTGANYMIRVK